MGYLNSYSTWEKICSCLYGHLFSKKFVSSLDLGGEIYHEIVSWNSIFDGLHTPMEPHAMRWVFYETVS